ncbi:MAG TPA: CsbD family protein [Burkholderiaceae bacterium]
MPNDIGRRTRTTADVGRPHLFTRSTIMNKDQVNGRAETVKGNVKEAAGKIVGNERLTAEGKADRLPARCSPRSATSRTTSATPSRTRSTADRSHGPAPECGAGAASPVPAIDSSVAPTHETDDRARTSSACPGVVVPARRATRG